MRSSINSKPIAIEADSIDDLVIKGIKYINENGEPIKARAGNAIQAYGVSYILNNSHNRVHNLRAPRSIRYFTRELLAYFNGSLNIDDGLRDASKFWEKIADEKGNINSNYGYYIFHQPLINEVNSKSQFEWVINILKENPKSRRAFININQVQHKSPTLDFPCTIGMQFYVRDNCLCADVSSRSTDVITGLPYDMGFFSLLTELIWQILNESSSVQLKLGYTKMNTTFTQIYERTSDCAKDIVHDKTLKEKELDMPYIDNGKQFIEDIYKHTKRTKTMEWIMNYANI